MTRSILQRLNAALCVVAIVVAGCSGKADAPHDAGGRTRPVSDAQLDAWARDAASSDAGAVATPLGFGGAPASAQGGPRYLAGNGLDVTGNTFSIENCITTGHAWVFNGTTMVCSPASQIDGTGTANRVAKWTDSNTIADTAFPIDDGATLLTLGDSQATDQVSVVGRIDQNTTAATASGYAINHSPVGGTTSGLAAGAFVRGGSMNTTGGNLTAQAVLAQVSTTESAGGNTLTNTALRGIASGSPDDNRGVWGATTGTGAANFGGVFEASGAGTVNYGVHVTSAGAGTNYAIVTTTGENALNITSGNTCIGSTGCTEKLRVAGTLAVTGNATIDGTISDSNSDVTIADGLNITGAATTANDVLTLGRSGTDATIAHRGAAGSNIVFRTSTAGGVEATAMTLSFTQGATVAGNIVSSAGNITAASGTVTAAALSITGNSALGDASGDSHIFNGFVTINEGTPTGISAADAASVLVLNQADGTNNYLSFRGNTTGGIAWATGGGSVYGRVVYNPSTNNFQIATNNTFRQTIFSTGAIAFGDTASTAIDDNTDALTVGNTGTGQTTNGLAVIRSSNTGSFNTTAGAIEQGAIYASNTATRSAGGNNLANYGIYATASGAQVNTAVRANGTDYSFYADGGAIFNVGNSTFGDTNTDTHTFNGDVSIIEGTTTASAAEAGTTLLLRQANSTSNYLTMQAVSAQSGIRFNNTSGAGDGSVVYDNSTRALLLGVAGTVRQYVNANGVFFLGDTANTAVADNLDVFNIGNTGTGQTTSNLSVINASNTGSYNTTSGNRTYYVGNFTASATESAGTNTLQGVAMHLSATGGDDAVGLWVDDGRTMLDGNLFTSGDAVFGAADTNEMRVRGRFVIDQNGAAPTINSCGTGAGVTGEAHTFQVTVGSGVGTCVVNFGRTMFSATPYCVFSAADTDASTDMASAGGAGDGPYISANATTVTLVFDANTDGSAPIYNVWCVDRG